MTQDRSLFEMLAASDFDGIAQAAAVDPARAAERDADGVSLLMHVLYRRQFALAERLLGYLEELDAFELAALGRREDLHALVERSHSAATNRSGDGYTVLHLAAFFGHDGIVADLIRRGAAVEAIAGNATLVRPLHSAVASGHLRIAERLLNAGADPNARQRAGFTPLHGAANAGAGDLVELLLGRGADPALRAADGRTPADLAREKGFEELAHRLEGGGG